MSRPLSRFLAAFGFLALGCAAEPAPPAKSAASVDAGDEATACARYAASMCETFDARSRSCDAVRRVSRWIAPSACVEALRHLDDTQERIAGLRKDCDEVGEKLCARVDQKPEICEGLKQDLLTVPPEDCGNLLEAYPQVEAAFMEKVASMQPLDEATQAALLEGNPPSFGPEGAAVKVVMFSDFQCPYCSRAAAVVDRLRKDYGERIRFVFRQFPLSFHENAHRAAEASLAAHAQGKFWPYHDLLFANQGALDAASLESYATQLGLDMAQFKQAMEGDALAAVVDADLALGERAHVQGTPTMLINGEGVENPLDEDAVTAQLDELLGANATAPAADAPAPAAEPSTPATPAP